MTGADQQLLDDHFRLLVFAFAEVVVPDAPLRVGEAEGGPVLVDEGAHTAHDRPGPQARSRPKEGMGLGLGTLLA